MFGPMVVITKTNGRVEIKPTTNDRLEIMSAAKSSVLSHFPRVPTQDGVNGLTARMFLALHEKGSMADGLEIKPVLSALGVWSGPYYIFASVVEAGKKTTDVGLDDEATDVVFVTAIPINDFLGWSPGMTHLTNIAITLVAFILLAFVYSPVWLVTYEHKDLGRALARTRAGSQTVMAMLVITWFVTIALWEHHTEKGLKAVNQKGLVMRTQELLDVTSATFETMGMQLAHAYYIYRFGFFKLFSPNLGTQDEDLRALANMNPLSVGIFVGNVNGEMNWYSKSVGNASMGTYNPPNMFIRLNPQCSEKGSWSGIPAPDMQAGGGFNASGSTDRRRAPSGGGVGSGSGGSNCIQSKCMRAYDWQPGDLSTSMTPRPSKDFCQYDPRYRAWYKGALAQRTVYFAPPYTFASSNQAVGNETTVQGITAGIPVFSTDVPSQQDESTLLAVIAVDVLSSDIGNRLADLRYGNDGEVYLVDRSGKLVFATGGGISDPKADAKDGMPGSRILAIDSPDPEVSSSAKAVLGAAESWVDAEATYDDAANPVTSTGVVEWIAGYDLQILTDTDGDGDADGSGVIVAREMGSGALSFISVVTATQKTLYVTWDQYSTEGFVMCMIVAIFAVSLGWLVLQRTSGIVVHMKGILEGTLNESNDEGMQHSLQDAMKERRDKLHQQYSQCLVDDDGDGKLSMAEAERAIGKQVAAALDKDGDGTVSQEEVDKYIESELNKAQSTAAAMKNQDGPGGSHAGSSHHVNFDLQTVFGMMRHLMDHYKASLEKQNDEVEPSQGAGAGSRGPVDVDHKVKIMGGELMKIGVGRGDVVNRFQAIIKHGEKSTSTWLSVTINSDAYRRAFLYWVLIALNGLSLVQDTAAGGVARERAGMPGSCLMAELVLVLLVQIDVTAYAWFNYQAMALDMNFMEMKSEMQATRDSQMGKSRKWSLYTHTRIGVALYIVTATLTLVDLIMALGSGHGDFRYGLFFRPLLVVIRWPRLWKYIYLLATAIAAVKEALYLFLVVVLVSSAQGVALLRNVYDTGDWKTDNQFNNMFNAFLTMYIFTSSGENFNESVNPALVASTTYMWFFIFYAFIGLFFMTSLIVAIFGEAYDAENAHDNSHKLDKWAGVCACFVAWADKEAPPEEEDGRPRLDFEAFKGIMVDSFPHIIKGVLPDMSEGSPFFEFDYEQLLTLFHFLDTRVHEVGAPRACCLVVAVTALLLSLSTRFDV